MRPRSRALVGRFQQKNSGRRRPQESLGRSGIKKILLQGFVFNARRYVQADSKVQEIEVCLKSGFTVC